MRSNREDRRERASRSIDDGHRRRPAEDVAGALNTRRSAGKGANGLPRPDGTLLVRKGPKSAIMANLFMPPDADDRVYVVMCEWYNKQRAGGWVRGKNLSVDLDAAEDFANRLLDFVEKQRRKR